jgi:hypothetical protein
MCFKKVQLWSAAVLVFAATVFSACSNSNDSESHQHPGEGVVHMVSFDTMGAEERTPITVYDGDSLETIVVAPYKEGFEFLGWSSSDAEFIPYDLSVPVRSDIFLYATWSGARDTAPGKHRLNVHLQGGAFRNVPLQVLGIDFSDGQTLSQLPRVNGRPDHSTLVFAAWNTEADGRGETIWHDTPLTEDMDIYAIWGVPLTEWEHLKALECGNSNAVYVIQDNGKYGNYNPFVDRTGPFAGFDREWSPLCPDANVPFKGHLYGDRFRTLLGTVSVRTSPMSVVYDITRPTARAGLFAYTDGAVIASVGIGTGVINTGAAAEYAGGFAAEMKNTRLERLSVNGEYRTVTGIDTYAGGIVGKGDNVTVVDSVFSGSMEARYAGMAAGYLTNSVIDNATARLGNFFTAANTDGAFVGRLVGYMKSGKIVNCAFGSSITTTASSGYRFESNYNNSYVGGFVGFAEDTEISLMSSGSPTYKPNIKINGDNSFAGLIAGGMLNSTVRGVKIYGSVSADYGAGSAVGGIAGKITGGSIKETILSIDNLTAGGASSKAGGVAGEVSGAEIAGNLVVGTDLPIAKTSVLMSYITAASAGPVTGDGAALGANNYIRSGILINGVPAAGREYKAIRGAKGFFDTALNWNFAGNDIWEMLEYYDYPTFKAERAEEFIKIYTEAEFLAISGDYYNTAPRGKNYILMNNLDFSSHTDRRPVGCVIIPTSGNETCNAFSGILLGSGKTIYGLNGRGLIGVSGTLRSLNISGAVTSEAVLRSVSGIVEDVHVTGATVSVGTSSTLGGIATSNTGTIIESSFSGTVTGTLTVGGIAGSSGGSSSGTAYIIKSFSEGSVSGIQYGTATAQNVGGITGDGGTINSLIEDCYSTAAVSAYHETAGTTTASTYAGGIVGLLRSNSKVINSHFAGSVSASAVNTGTSSNVNAYVGGIIANMFAGAEISSSLSLAGSVDATVNKGVNAYAGRIAAYRGASGVFPNTIVDNSYGLTSTVLTGASQDPTNQGSDVTAIDTAFFGTYLPSWDLADTWFMTDGMSYPALR